MLVLSRKKGEAVVIQDNIEITVLEINGDTIKLGFKAPREVEILRKELYAQVEQSNLESATQVSNLQILKDQLKKMKKNTKSY
ncbi:carbon storage regulator CsrA [Paenibacillus sp. CF384]|uniref:carbon storage regulator CsrA n=1 Tax=Paenibacillus sp. CF384 TaxID=1884382 RepID=UPI00089C01F6|nr:carbon storage regulator CsrA [Paenibacillus sp. CF384]SDX28414.1 carbon storage regulator, CsrA [Paenibacillus sp. CF384]